MSLLDSAIARLMFAVLTAGVGMVALRSQSDFWLGALVVLVASWAFRALGELVGPRGRGHRATPGAFLVALSAGLAVGFGPWSDASMRGAIPNTAAGIPGYIAAIQPATAGFLRLRHHVDPCPRAEIWIDGPGNRRHVDVTILGTQGRPDSVDNLAWDFETSLNPHLDATTRTGLGPNYTMTDESFGVYLDACYLLSSLLLGWAAAAVVGLVVRLRGSRPVARGDRSSIADPMQAGS